MKLFKGCLPQLLLDPFWNTLTQLLALLQLLALAFIHIHMLSTWKIHKHQLFSFPTQDFNKFRDQIIKAHPKIT